MLVAAGTDLGHHRARYFELGRAYLEVSEPSAALQVFEALAMHGDLEGPVSNNRGVALMELARFDEAVAAFRHAVSVHPEGTVERFNLALALWLSGRGEAAVTELTRASERAPVDAALHWVLAEASAETAPGDSERARATAALLAPDADPATFATARAVSHETRAAVPREAPVDASIGLELDALLQVWTLREGGDAEAALGELRRALYHSPAAMSLRRELVDVLQHLGRLDDAARELQMMIWTAPSARTHVELARVYQRLGRPADALDEVEKALQLEPAHDDAHRLRDELAALAGAGCLG